MKKVILFFSLWLGLASALPAQTPAAETAATSVWDDPMLLFYVTVGFVFVVLILVLLVAVYMLKTLNTLVSQAEREKAQQAGVPYKAKPSLWETLWAKSNDFTPMEEEAKITLHHNYDGIQELDNHLPPWWTGLFYGTIVFSIVYLLAFHVFDSLPLSTKEYDNELVEASEQAKKMQTANPVAAVDETNVEVTTDEQALADGKQVFMNNCASCHRKDGGGDIGPNLTDEYWLHGGSIKDIFKTVRHGVTGTNMIAWEGFISPEKMRNVSSYVLKLQGTNPSNPKKPQGEIFKPTQNDAAKDTVKTQASL